jgi:hypothetical protein
MTWQVIAVSQNECAVTTRLTTIYIACTGALVLPPASWCHVTFIVRKAGVIRLLRCVCICECVAVLLSLLLNCGCVG